MENATPALLTVRQLGKYLNIGVNASYSLAHTKGFPRIRVGRKILVPVTLLERWLEQEANKSNSNPNKKGGKINVN